MKQKLGFLLFFSFSFSFSFSFVSLFVGLGLLHNFKYQPHYLLPITQYPLPIKQQRWLAQQ